MDGFYVAKFKVEKKGKVFKKDEEKDKGVKGEVEAENAGEAFAFDDEEDKPYLEGECNGILLPVLSTNHLVVLLFLESKRKSMKAKGLRVRPRTKSNPIAPAAANPIVEAAA